MTDFRSASRFSALVGALSLSLAPGCGRIGFEEQRADEDAATDIDAPLLPQGCTEWVENGGFDAAPTSWDAGDGVILSYDDMNGQLRAEAIDSVGLVVQYRITDPEAFTLGRNYVFTADLGCEAPPGDIEMEIRAYSKADEFASVDPEVPATLTCGEMTPHSASFLSFPDPFPGDEVVEIALRFDWADELNWMSGRLLIDNVSYRCRSD